VQIQRKDNLVQKKNLIKKKTFRKTLLTSTYMNINDIYNMCTMDVDKKQIQAQQSSSYVFIKKQNLSFIH